VSYGLDVPPLNEATLTALRDFLPAAAGLSNPIKVLSPGRGCVVVDARVLLRRI
jgi:acyl-CoA synthetase (NDP forming)